MRITVGRSLDGCMAAQAAGRVLVIDAYRMWNCGTWVGDITTRWEPTEPTEGFEPATMVEGVAVAVRSDLVALLDSAGPSLHRGGVLRRGAIRVQLERPEIWIDWLERPGAISGRPQTNTRPTG